MTRSELRLLDPSAPNHEQALHTFRENRAKRAQEPSTETPLSRLAVELLLARASTGDAIESVTVDDYWVTVIRGSAPLDHEGFRVGDLCPDYFGFLPAIG